MIRYALACEHEHPFEAWFSNSADFDVQVERGLVECPFCASRQVRKQIMAPAVTGTSKTAPAPSPEAVRTMMMQAAQKVRAHVEANFENVGDGFASEARAIHEGRSEPRGIYGNATSEQVRSLREDGVPCAPLPPAPPRPETLN